MNELIQKLDEEFQRKDKLIQTQKNIIETLRPSPRKGEKPQLAAQYGKIPIETCTWEEIDVLARNGYASTVFCLGDTKSVTIAGEKMKVRIIGFDHDVDENGDTASITFETTGLLPGVITPSDGAIGVEDIMMAGYGIIPNEVWRYIKPVMKMYRSPGAKSPTPHNCPFFVLAESEIFGRPIYSSGDEGKWYDWYRQENVRYRKRHGTVLEEYWTRSMTAKIDDHICTVSHVGNSHHRTFETGLRAPIAFCI